MGFLGVIAAFVALTFAELYVTVHAVPDAIGAPATIALVIASSILGWWLVKQQGRVVWRRFTSAVGQGRIPDQELLDGVLVIVGGAFLIVPGFVTDAIGLFLLLPVTRPLGRRASRRWLRRRGVAVFGRARSRRAPREDFDVEGTATDAEPTTAQPPTTTAGRLGR